MASKILLTLHETAAGLFEIEAINRATMRERDLLCLCPARKRAPEVIRALAGASEATTV